MLLSWFVLSVLLIDLGWGVFCTVYLLIGTLKTSPTGVSFKSCSKATRRSNLGISQSTMLKEFKFDTVRSALTLVHSV